MTQVEHPGNLAKWDNPAYELVTVILMRCGLRVSDALKLAFDSIVQDADGAPYLRYVNHKMKREALVPIDEEVHQLVNEHRQRVLARWPGGCPHLFPGRQRTPTADDRPRARPTDWPSTAGSNSARSATSTGAPPTSPRTNGATPWAPE